jgi:uncharacterized protein YbcI
VADATAPGSPAKHAPFAGELLAAVSRSLVRLHKECYGKGPTRARTYASENLVVYILEGGLTKGERTLRDHGHEDAVQDQRQLFQEVLRKRFVETVEGLLGRKVLTFISGVDAQTETSAEVFVLEPAGLEVGDESSALAGWGDQVRRQARTLREEQAVLREQQAQLRRRSADARAMRPDSTDD